MKSLVISLCLLLLTSCKTAPKSAVEIAPNQYQVPVVSGQVSEPAGWEFPDEIVQLTVPPSDKPTTVYVKPAKKSLLKKIFPPKKDIHYEVVASIPTVTVVEEPRTPWWYWFVGITAGLGTVWFVVRRYLGTLTTGVKWVGRLLKIIK